MGSTLPLRHEGTNILPERFTRYRMGDAGAAAARVVGPWAPTDRGAAGGRERHLLRAAHRLSVALPARGLSQLEHRVLVFRLLAKAHCPRLEVIWTDGAFQGTLVEWVHDTCGWRLEIVNKPPGQQGFAVIPKRWVVERTFGWIGRNRRLSKDYEEYAETTEA